MEGPGQAVGADLAGVGGQVGFELVALAAGRGRVVHELAQHEALDVPGGLGVGVRRVEQGGVEEGGGEVHGAALAGRGPDHAVDAAVVAAALDAAVQPGRGVQHGGGVRRGGGRGRLRAVAAAVEGPGGQHQGHGQARDGDPGHAGEHLAARAPAPAPDCRSADRGGESGRARVRGAAGSGRRGGGPVRRRQRDLAVAVVRGVLGRRRGGRPGGGRCGGRRGRGGCGGRRGRGRGGLGRLAQRHRRAALRRERGQRRADAEGGARVGAPGGCGRRRGGLAQRHGGRPAEGFRAGRR